MALRWNQGKEEDWSNLGTDIWRIATKTLASTVPKLRQLIRTDPAAAEAHERFSYGARLLRGGRNAPNSYLRRVTALLTNPRALLDTSVLVQDICQASAEKFGEVQLGHAQDVADRYEEALLYVERAVRDPAIRPGSSQPSEIRTEDLISPGHVTHVVITGDPGVGKSTFMRHVFHTLANRREPKLAPLLVDCREYAAGANEKSIIDFIANALQGDLAVPTFPDALKTVLTLGAACIIFDGVDEIIDLQQRRRFIRRIESLAAAYPYSSIICSTRKIGYQQASFKQSFHVLELREFTPEEFETYVRRWFHISARPEGDVESFLRESNDVRDIRNNPLMLSLLCTLYRARGHIPRNRRQVYRECADLLFQRWDAMRHVEQPFDHRHYGNRLMQELARFFYQSQSAQAGIEEGQLVRIIAHFFRDTAAVEPPEDEQRARQFLEFCAGRAWLLSRKGTNARGIRLFAFTHRTFMEYMAAEALVRNAPDIRTVAIKALDVFKQDPSSVIPDVMVQAVDDKFDRGAEQVLQILFEEGRKVAPSLVSDRFLALCLRIINSSPMSKRVATALPGMVASYWEEIDDVNDSRESTYALFELYRDPRSRILSATDQGWKLAFHGKEYSSALLKWHLISRWVRLELLGHGKSFDPEWSERISSYMNTDLVPAMVSSAGRPVKNWRDPILMDFMLTAGYARASNEITRGVKPAVCISVFGERLPGSVTHALRDIVETGNSPVRPHSIDIIQAFDRILSVSTACKIDALAAISIGEMLKVDTERIIQNSLASQEDCSTPA
jgi:NACHT domain